MLRSSQLTGFGVRPLVAAVPAVGGELLVGETDAMGLDFSYHTDTAKQLYISDLTTPANNYNGTAEGKLTYTSPSAKLTRRASGTWTFTNGTTELPYEWDAAGVSLGMLIEEARTNLAQRSQEASNAYWVKTNSSVSADSTTAPDGTSTADTLTEDSATSTHTLHHQFNGILSSGTNTWSVFVKANGRTWLALSTYDATTGGKNANFDLTNITTGTVDGGVTARIIDAGNSWRRVSMTWIVGDPSTVYPSMNLASADNVTTYAGNGTSGVFLWGMQVEAGLFPTSYITTTSAAASRNVDNISLATSAFGHSATVGSLYAKFRPLNVASIRVAVAMDDGTAAERIAIGSGVGVGILTVLDGSSEQVGPLTSGTVTANANNLVAASWAANDFALSVNGGTVATDVSGTLPTVTSLRFGTAASAVSLLNGHLMHVAHYKRTLSDGQLVTRTT